MVGRSSIPWADQSLGGWRLFEDDPRHNAEEALWRAGQQRRAWRWLYPKRFVCRRGHRSSTRRRSRAEPTTIVPHLSIIEAVADIHRSFQRVLDSHEKLQAARITCGAKLLAL